MIIKIALVILFCCMLASCASLMNTSYTDVVIYTEKPSSIVHNRDTIRTDSIDGTNVLQLSVERSGNPLILDAANDECSKSITMDPKKSIAYYMNIFTSGLGFLIDMNSDERYGYRSPVFVTNDLVINNDALPKNYRQVMMKMKNKNRLALDGNRHIGNYDLVKGDLYFNLALPFIYPGQSTLTPRNYSRDSHFGILGFGAGFDYYYKDNRFIKFMTTASFPGGITIGGREELSYDERANIYIYTFSLSHNHRYKKFSFGYGISYAINDWRTEGSEIDSDSHSYVSSPKYPYYSYIQYYSEYICRENKYSTLGLTLNGYYCMGRYFAIGFVYNPYLVRLKTEGGNRFSYDHLVSLDFSFKFRLRKGK